jgi:hypothetical protein
MMASVANPNAAFDFADQLALVSIEVFRFRIKNRPTLSDDEKAQLEKLETKLDNATAKVRAQGIADLGTLTAGQVADVESATQDMAALLRRIKLVERALGIATAVLNLALAATTGAGAAAIVAALKGIKDAADPSAA